MSDASIEVRIGEIGREPEVEGEEVPAEDSPENPYSGMIVSDEEMVKEILEYLEREMTREENRREKLLKRCATYRRQLDALPKEETRTGPMKNPSNVVPPLAMIQGQGMYGHIHAHFSERKPFWTAKAIKDDKETREDAKFWTRYLGLLSEGEGDLNLPGAEETVSLESAVMPVCFVKVPWTTIEWNFKEKDSAGGWGTVSTVFRDGPELVPIPIEDVLYPGQWKTVYEMPWISHLLHLPEHTVEMNGATGKWRNTEKVLDYAREHANPEEAQRDQAEGKGAERGKTLDFCESHFYWDVDGDGKVEDMIWVIHRESGTVLRMDYNELGIRQFVDFNFMFKTGSIEGRGTGQICSTLQDEAEGIHNVRNDGMKLVNMRMLAMRRAVMLTNKEDIYNGKIWQCDTPKEDIAPIQLSEVYPSSLEAENWTWAMAAQGTGSQDLAGQPNAQLGSRDTYRGTALRTGKAGSMFSAIVKRMERQWGKVAMLVVFNLIRNRDRVLANEREAGRLNQRELGLLERVLSVKVSELPKRFKFLVRTTDLDLTYEALKQSVLTLNQVQGAYVQQMLPLVQTLFGPQQKQILQLMPELYQFMLKMLSGQTKMTESIFKFFNVEDTENYLPSTERWDQLLEVLKIMQGGGTGGQGTRGSEGETGGPAGLAGAAGGGGGIPASTESSGGGNGGGEAGAGGTPGIRTGAQAG
jgi:hypothetical protein